MSGMSLSDKPMNAISDKLIANMIKDDLNLRGGDFQNLGDFECCKNVEVSVICDFLLDHRSFFSFMAVR